MNRQTSSGFTKGAVLLFALFGAGCASLGPGVVSRDRLNYQDVLSNSWKTQTLLNLVRLRYADPPIMLDVASIVNSYSWEAGASLESLFGPHVTKENTFGLHGTYTDRPTITYSPVMGEKFTKSIMTPITPTAIMSLVQTGYPADLVFSVCVRSINGVSNQVGSYVLRRPADPSFFPLLEALRRIQASGTFGMRLEKRGSEETVLVFIRRGANEPADSDAKFVADTLGLAANTEYQLVFGAVARKENEIAMLSRSMLEILSDLGSYLDVPESDVAENRTTPRPAFGTPMKDRVSSPIRVHHGSSSPADAYAAARYRGRWWWVDDNDLPSKRMFGFLMLLFSLAETGGHPNVPVLTIPAG